MLHSFFISTNLIPRALVQVLKWKTQRSLKGKGRSGDMETSIFVFDDLPVKIFLRKVIKDVGPSDEVHYMITKLLLEDFLAMSINNEDYFSFYKSSKLGE